MPGDAADRIRMITLRGYRPAAGERALARIVQRATGNR